MTVAGSVPQAARSGLVTLFTVQFRHDYYNAADGLCRDIVAVPTDDSAAFMKRIGISAVQQGDGFSVVIPQTRVPAMIDAIAQDYGLGAAGGGYWSRLTFLLLLNNDGFVGITAWPIDTSPTRQAFFADNIDVGRKKTGFQLGGADGLGADALRPTTNGTIALPPIVSGTVTVFDISGQPVATVDTDRDMPATLSFAGLPYDRYTIEAMPAAAYAGPPEVVYVPPAPCAMGMIDLLLARPDATTGLPSAFPLSALPASPPPGLAARPIVPKTVRLIAQFAARETYWQYYVVPQFAGGLHDDLTITGKGTKFRKSADLLPNGDAAVLFSAISPLPLRQRPTHAFALGGRRLASNGGTNDINIAALPVAPAMPVWPAANDPLAGTSEIFVYV